MFGEKELREVLDNKFDVQSYIKSADIFSNALEEYSRCKELDKQRNELEER